MACARGMKMSEIEVRRAQESDVPKIAKIVNTWIDQTDWFPRVYPAQEIQKMVQENFSKRVIWVSGEPVSGYLSFDPETSKVIGLYCDESGKGGGKALLDQAREGRDRVWLTVHEPNTRAQKFYQREGFEEVSRYDPEPPETVREIRMEWQA